MSMIRILAGSLCCAFAIAACDRPTHIESEDALPNSSQGMVISNDFAGPEDVVRRYLERDAAGQVYFGMLQVERYALTTWVSSPHNDSFLIADNYEIESVTTEVDSAAVVVNYKIRGIGDAHGTVTKSRPENHQVQFELVRDEVGWRIAAPHYLEIEPVLSADVANRFRS